MVEVGVSVRVSVRARVRARVSVRVSVSILGQPNGRAEIIGIRKWTGRI